MTTRYAKKRITFLSMALGSLIITSLSSGNAEAGWSGARCKVQCTKNSVKKDARLNDCATNCDNTDIMDILLPNAARLNETNQEHFQAAVKYQQSVIEKQLKAETAKGKKASKSKIKDLNAKQDQLIAEINRMRSKKDEAGEATTLPLRPTSKTPSRKIPPRPTSEPEINKPSTDLPPEVPNQGPPTDLPPLFPQEAEKVQEPTVPSEDEPMKIGTGPAPKKIPTPPSLGKKPLTYKEKQELLKQQGNTQPQATTAETPTVSPSGTTNEPSPQENRKSITGNRPDGGNLAGALAGLGDNPIARLRKIDAGSEVTQYNLSDEEKKMLDRRVSLEPDKIKEETESSLQTAKAMNNRANIAKYTAQLTYIEEKLKDAEDDEWK